MDKKILIPLIVVVLVVIAGAYLLTKNPQTSNNQTQSTDNQMTQTTTPSEQPSQAATESSSPVGSAMQSSVKEFTVTGSSFKFDPATLTVSKGDKVKVTFKSAGGLHDFVIDEFNVKSKTIGSGQDVVEFTADKSGSFNYYCSVGNHRAMGMQGTLTVQ